MNFKQQLIKEIVEYLSTIPNKYKESVYNNAEIKNPPSLGFFVSNPYKGWMMNEDVLFGFKKFRVVFSKDRIKILEKSYPNYNEFLGYMETDDDELLKSFFNKIRVYVKSDNELIDLANTIEEGIVNVREKVKNDYQLFENKTKEDEELRLEDLNISKENVLQELDKNSDGILDLIDNDFNKLLARNQKIILGIDKNFIHQFVKVSNYIKTKQQNTQKIFESIKETSHHDEMSERVSLLKNQIYSYELLVFHSINMIGALVSEDLITFYEIYESFDKLGMYNSNWENEVSEKLTNIGDKLDDLMFSIAKMEHSIVNELNHLTYVTQTSFTNLNRSVIGQLKEVESSINMNNLLTGIQTYQLYKINKNTKGLSQ